MGADVPSLGLSNKAVLEGDQSVPEVDKHVKDQYPDVYFKPDAYDKPPTEDTLVQNTLWPEIQKVKKPNILKSVHFKKSVAEISFLSKLWYFQYKPKQKVPQF